VGNVIQARRMRLADRSRFDVSGLVSGWLLADGRNRMILTSAGRLVWSNYAADRYLNAGVDFHGTREQVRVADPHQCAAFEAFLAAASEEMSAWFYRRHSGDGGLLLRAWRLATEPETCVGLIFHSTGSDFVPRWADFATAFGLTPAEHRMATGLLEGHSPDELAVLCGVGVGTVRTHIKRLYGKLDVCTRGEFFRKLAPFRLS
jgi:DNA-binding CsgD family transcriptional regulator